MAAHPLTGSRIRARRLDEGIRQADLAGIVGISPSYLNLIEHNRRRIAGKLLVDLARALKVEPAALTEGADLALLDQMRSGAADVGEIPEIDKAEELASRYPGWAAVIAAQARKVQALDGKVDALRDRMTHDPQLAGALHAVISAVTSIRSTAAILIGDDKIDADWQRRFHQNIHDDSLRLAAQSDALMTYLQAPTEMSGDDRTPHEEAEAFLARTADLQLQVERNPNGDIIELIDGYKSKLSKAALAALRATLIRQAQDANLLPLSDFADSARQAAYDPAKIASRTGAALPLVLRRLAALSSTDDHPPMGLVTCDGAGVVTSWKSAPGFVMPRHGPGCPLWPLYTALAQPARAIKQVVSLPDASQTRLLCYAIATPSTGASFDAAPIVTATMLVLPDAPDDGAAAAPVGQTCRICPRDACAARREPSILGG